MPTVLLIFFQKHEDQKALPNLPELKGYFLASSMILSIPVNEELFIKENQSLWLRAENSVTRGFKVNSLSFCHLFYNTMVWYP